MSDTKYIGDNFTVSPGHILVSPIEDTNKFRIKKKSEGLTSESRVGKVLAVGKHFVNDFGVERHKPCKEGDTILYIHNYNANILEIEFIEYPVIKFSEVLGVLKDAS